jgi:hypothetical protein
MMESSFHAAAIDELRERCGEDGVPAVILPRRDGEDWVVYQRTDGGERWCAVQSGDYVRVPLVAHRTTSADPAMAVAYAFRTGFLVREDLGRLGVRKLQVVIGTPVQEWQDSRTGEFGFVFWLGFAASVSR